MKSILALATVALILAATGPGAAAIMRADAYCPSSGESPLRQTVVVIDDSLVHRAPPGAPPPEENRLWIVPLLQVADADRTAIGTMLPGELLTVFVARRDTAELVPIFHGCSPNLSTNELADLREGQSAFSTFLFGEQTMEDRRREFDDALIDAYGLLIREDRPTASDANDAVGFFRAMASAPSLYSVTSGIPRVLLITPFDTTSAWQDATAARQQGFELATEIGLDLQRAEVYLVAASATADHSRDFAEAFLLGSRGRLAGWRQTGLPQLDAAPERVTVYGGSVEIAGLNAPVQLRLAADAQGTLVNSWIEVTRLDTIATPLTGKMICTAPDQCVAKGDGRTFAQMWSVTPLSPVAGHSTMFREDLAWSGFRQIEITIRGETAEVWIYEPNVVIEMPDGDGGGKQTLNGYRFSAQISQDQRF